MTDGHTNAHGQENPKRKVAVYEVEFFVFHLYVFIINNSLIFIVSPLAKCKALLNWEIFMSNKFDGLEN
jgi:hypothetical protein